MKKIILILCLVFLLTGCTVEYNATFTNDTVQENIITKGINYDSFPVSAYINDQEASEENVVVEGIEYYKINLVIIFLWKDIKNQELLILV